MTAEPCRGRRGDVAGYALGLLSPHEATRTLAHLDGCATCREALVELKATAAVLPLADVQRIDSQPIPPADLGERIQQRVRDDRRAHEARQRRRKVVSWVGAAAAAILVVVAAFAITSMRDDDLALRSFTVAAPGVDAAYRLEANDQGTAVTFEHRGLDPDGVYWLWLTDDAGRRVSAGTFQGSGDTTRVTLQSALPEREAVRIWVTDEADDVVLDAQIGG